MGSVDFFIFTECPILRLFSSLPLLPFHHLVRFYQGNEEIKSAMIREAKEEVAIQIQPEDLKVVGVMHRKASDERIDFFLATHHWDGQIINAEPHKCDDLSWFDLDALPDNIVPYVRKALENYQKDIWFDSVGWDEAH